MRFVHQKFIGLSLGTKMYCFIISLVILYMMNKKLILLNLLEKKLRFKKLVWRKLLKLFIENIFESKIIFYYCLGDKLVKN